MMDGFVRRWGRAAALAVFTSLLATLIMAAMLLLASMDVVPGESVADIAWSYFAALGVIGGATQAPNFAERLPGARSWDNPHRLDMPQNRRASDRNRDERP